MLSKNSWMYKLIKPSTLNSYIEFLKFNITQMIRSGYPEEEIWNEIKTCTECCIKILLINIIVLSL